MPDKSLLEKLDRYWYKPLSEVTPNIQFIASYKEKWQTLIPLFEQISERHAVFIFIYNTIIKRFVYVVDKRNMMGYDASLYLGENGYEFSMSNIHPDYLHPMLLLQQEGFDFLFPRIKQQRDKAIVNLESLYKKSSGEYFYMLQQSMCIENDNEGAPVLFIGYVHDVTYLKKPGTLNTVMTSADEIKWLNFNFDLNSIERVQPLSRQEKKNLLFLAEGKSSKEIANDLFISPSTVDKHRKNLLKKTNCLNTTGMITYLRLVGLI